jgi:putative ABC transport system substrate-binding protein
VKRREFIALVGGATAGWPLQARAQQRTMSRIGVVMGSSESDPEVHALVAVFQQELQKLGWTQGRNVVIDVRFASGDREGIRALAVELMSLQPDLMVANSNLVTSVLQSEVTTVPLLFIGAADPIGSGIVTNFARPTGNITGFSTFDPSMGGKWLEMLREIAPRVNHVGFVLHPETPANVNLLRAAEAAAPALKVGLTALGVHNASDIERAIGSFAGELDRGLVVAPHAITRINASLIIELASRHRLPAVYAYGSSVRAGGLLSYGTDFPALFRQGAGYADRILKGAKPAELPVQGPTKLEVVVNLKTARAFGLETPPSLLARADEVIE